MLSTSELLLGVPSSLSATTGSENCTCMAGYFTSEGNSFCGVILMTQKSFVAVVSAGAVAAIAAKAERIIIVENFFDIFTP